MTTEVSMPQMGESIAEGTITKWLVEVGDRVQRDQPLLEISTDKVDAEIPSPADGVVSEIRFAEGETVEVDTVLALIEAAAVAGEAAGEGAEIEPEDEPEEEVAAEWVPAEERAGADEPAMPTTAEQPVAAPAREGQVISLEERVRSFSSPVVRRIAAEEGVDLRQLSGSGIHGRVTKQDIFAYLEEREASPGPPRSPLPSIVAEGAAESVLEREAAAPVEVAASAAQALEVKRPERASGGAAPPSSSPIEGFSVPAYREGDRVELEPMSRIRQITAAHMLYSQQTSAHVATVFDVDLSNVVAMRKQAKEKFASQVGTKLTFMPFIFQAVIAALKTYPKFNASLDGTNVVYKRDVNLGMAVALDWGLIVPVIHDADQLSLVGLAQKANDLADRARTKRLKPDEVQGGTFTITNPGVFGSLFGTPIINQPQVAILCVGAIEKRPVVITDRNGNDGLAIRSMAYLALSYDHRLIDGADAERFMVTVKQVLSEGEWSELAAYV